MIPLARMRLRSARLPFEDPRGRRRRRGERRRLEPPAAARAGDASGASSWSRCSARCPALAALRDPELASYHAVEHKAIGGYEQGR